MLYKFSFPNSFFFYKYCNCSHVNLPIANIRLPVTISPGKQEDYVKRGVDIAIKELALFRD